MKIDSPTFLTETTFISSSVVFSSGSQKFGNTSDDIQQFTGSISISETGSFKRAVIGRASTDSSYSSTTGGDVAFGVDASGKRIILRASHVEIGSDDYWGINAFTKDSDATLFLRQGMHIFTSGNNQGMRIYNTYGSAYNSYVERAGNSWLGTSSDGGHLVLRNYGSGGTQVWHGSNVVVDVKASATGSSTLLTLEDSKISGSSTSTGSFGALQVPGNVSIGTESTSHDFPLVVQGADNSTLIRIGGASNSDGGQESEIFVGNAANSKWHNLKINAYNTRFTVAGTETLKISANSISGSSTSTGSFGVVAATEIQNPNQASSRTVLLKDILRLATDTPGNGIGIQAVGHGGGDYYIDFYNYQGGDPYIRLQTSSGQGNPYINFKNASYPGLTFAMGSGYNAENFVLVSGSNADNLNSAKDTVFRVLSKIHGESPTA